MDYKYHIYQPEKGGGYFHSVPSELLRFCAENGFKIPEEEAGAILFGAFSDGLHHISIGVKDDKTITAKDMARWDDHITGPLIGMGYRNIVKHYEKICRKAEAMLDGARLEDLEDIIVKVRKMLPREYMRKAEEIDLYPYLYAYGLHYMGEMFEPEPCIVPYGPKSQIVVIGDFPDSETSRAAGGGILNGKGTYANQAAYVNLLPYKPRKKCSLNDIDPIYIYSSLSVTRPLLENLNPKLIVLKGQYEDLLWDGSYVQVYSSKHYWYRSSLIEIEPPVPIKGYRYYFETLRCRRILAPIDSNPPPIDPVAFNKLWRYVRFHYWEFQHFLDDEYALSPDNNY